VVDITIMHIL